MSSSGRAFDIVLLGAGHNALVAAAYLAKAGRSVVLLDRAEVPGGFVRTEELTLPGFLHDTYSAVHPLLVNGPVFAELGQELEDFGLRYVQSRISTGVSLRDGRSAVIPTDPRALRTVLDRLGERAAWADLMADRFRSEELRATFLPWPLHVGVGPQEAGGALWTAAMMAALTRGNPAPVGGSGRLTTALVGLVERYGGVVVTGTEVDEVLVGGGRATAVRTTDGDVWTAARAVIATTAVPGLYLIGGATWPGAGVTGTSGRAVAKALGA
jgi:phytoene dehydrogenase-like protein